MGLTLEKAGKEVLGSAVKVVITKDSTLIVTDGSTQNAVEQRVTQLRSLVEVPTLCFSDMCPSLNLKLQTYSPYVMVSLWWHATLVVLHSKLQFSTMLICIGGFYVII